MLFNCLPRFLLCLETALSLGTSTSTEIDRWYKTAGDSILLHGQAGCVWVGMSTGSLPSLLKKKTFLVVYQHIQVTWPSIISPIKKKQNHRTPGHLNVDIVLVITVYVGFCVQTQLPPFRTHFLESPSRSPS